jgi:dTDP-4-dehydrorhamnose 3,5-epimerase-like enzyme
MTDIRIHRLDKLIWEDDRGWGVRPLEAAGLTGGKSVGDVHVVSLRPGHVRGNHYHDGPEWLLVFGGTLEVRSRRGDEGALGVETVEGDNPVLLEIPPGVRHSLKNESNSTLFLLAFSDRDKLITTPAPL